MSGVASVLMPGSLVSAGVTAYFAPVDRTNGVPTPFDPAQMGRFDLTLGPAGWLAAGPVSGFACTPAPALEAVRSGAPATVKVQARAAVEAEVSFRFAGWSKLAMALSSGVTAMNLLRPAAGAFPRLTGGSVAAASAVLAGSTASVLQVPAGSGIEAGDLIAVDEDYAGQLGYVGAGAGGAYVQAGDAAGLDVHFLRRVTFNVARVLSVSGGAVTLAAGLPAGAPSVAMKVARVTGFADRMGGAFVPEWSALFALDGMQGERMLFHYPRLQPTGGVAAEERETLARGLERWRPAARMRALPVVDPNDGVATVCVRSYLPAPTRAA